MTREEIIEGLKRWARGYYPAQTAVTFLAGTDEPLTHPWVESTLIDGEDGGYWLNWEAFDEHGGVLSGSEYATWALARSLCQGELAEHLWWLDPARSNAFAMAIVTAREDWPRG